MAHFNLSVIQCEKEMKMKHNEGELQELAVFTST